MYNPLTHPLIYNLRFLVAGSQQRTKDFISRTYKKYKCRSVIDIGCGTGDFCLLFKSDEYTGMDYNPRYIQYAQHRYPYSFITADVTTYPFSSHYDAALFISTLHHLSDTEVTSVFSKLTKIINKVIIIVDLNPDTSSLKLLLIKLDRGNHVRNDAEKSKLLEPFGKAVQREHFSTGLASQTGIVLAVK
ncbi:MAG TPA: class I SAM-dependent methyltransferase [Patescibacteria group bacterium]|nr:class I SAM-dependent methyltransferase [Patescibacteria group bacterium]